MREYDTPHWAQIVLWAIVLTGLGCALVFADEKPITCKQVTYPHVECEAHVFPNEAYWTVSINDIRADYHRGILVYLTLPDDVWAKIEVKVQKYTLTFYGRWHNGKTEFKQ